MMKWKLNGHSWNLNTDRVISATELESEESEVSISYDSAYGSVTYDSVKTRLSELEAEVEK